MIRKLFRKIMQEDERKSKELQKAYYICLKRGYISAPNDCVILLKKDGVIKVDD